MEKGYTKCMKKFLHRIFPAEFFKNPAYVRALVLAGLYLVFCLTQLFTFERFTEVTAGYGLPGGAVTAAVLAGLIPLLEVMALPYLISMKLSSEWRRVSMWATLAVPILWLLIALWLNFAPALGEVNTGIFGATLVTMSGLWFVLFSALLLWSAVLTVRELPSRTMLASEEKEEKPLARRRAKS